MRPSIESNYNTRLLQQRGNRTNYLLKHAIKTRQLEHYLLWSTTVYHCNQLCSLRGRPRAVWTYFGLSRQSIRQLMALGSLSGVYKRTYSNRSEVSINAHLQPCPQGKALLE